MPESTLYLKIINGEVLAYGDYETAAAVEEQYKTGRICDATVDQNAWDAAGGCARLVNGEIVLGLAPEELLAKQGEAIRNERYLRLRRLDKISNLYWEELTDEQKDALRAYRHALLDITDQEGFPWGGNIEKAPWPVKPEFFNV